MQPCAGENCPQNPMIYLDANATSRLRPSARSVLSTVASGALELGNPSSIHAAGRKARAAISLARTQLLSLVGAAELERSEVQVVFTSGGTEACNMLALGLLGPAGRAARGRVVTSAIEHAAVNEPLKQLEKAGWEIVWVRPEKNGIVPVERFCEAVSAAETALVCLMGANNETGAVQPVDAVSRTLRGGRSGRPFSGPIVCDMTQALGKSLLNLPSLFEAGVTAVALSGHKIGAPSGVGAFIAAGSKHGLCVPFEPLLCGGPQENRLRAGTENLAGIIAFGAAAEELKTRLSAELKLISALRERLWHKIAQGFPAAQRLTPPSADYGRIEKFSDQRSLSNTLSLRLPPCRGDDLVVALDLAGLAASTGSACSSGKQTTSPVLTAAGLEPAEARQVIRLSLDWNCSKEEIDRAAAVIVEAASRMAENCRALPNVPEGGLAAANF